MAAVGRWLVAAGLLAVVAGLALLALARLGLPGPGRLPGDVTVRGRNWAVFIPLGTSLALSVGGSLLLYLLSRIGRH